MNELSTQLESLLFVASKPVTTKQLADIVNKSTDETLAALQVLQSNHAGAGIVLMEAGGQWQLGTNPQNVDLVKAFLTADLREKLTDATVEVLGIIAYRQPISKSEIEAIRGVNSQYSIRQLLMRGLIEKVSNPNDSRSNYYQVTTEFLQHMGLQSTSELPEFEKLTASIKLPETPQAKPEEQNPSENNTPSNSSVGQTYQDPTGHTTPTSPENWQPTNTGEDAEEFEDEDDDEDEE